MGRLLLSRFRNKAGAEWPLLFACHGNLSIGIDVCHLCCQLKSLQSFLWLIVSCSSSCLFLSTICQLLEKMQLVCFCEVTFLSIPDCFFLLSVNPICLLFPFHFYTCHELSLMPSNLLFSKNLSLFYWQSTNNRSINELHVFGL